MQTSLKNGLAAGVAAVVALQAGAASARDLVFGYIPNNMAYTYNVSLMSGFNEKAAEKGVKVVLLDPKMSMEAQANMIDDLLLQKVDAIGFMPNDSLAVQPLIDKVAKAGIPIVATAVPVGDPDVNPPGYVYPNLTALVTTDDVESGRIAGLSAATLLPADRQAKIAIVEGATGNVVVRQRTQGFEESLKKKGVKYQIVASQPTDWTPESGESVCQNLLTANPDLDMIFSQADSMAVGCARAITAAGSNALLVSSTGGSELGAQALQLGELDSSVCIQPKLMGELTFTALYEAVSNPAAAKKGQYITYKQFPLTKDNVADCPLTGW